jgi:hypothetical protein
MTAIGTRKHDATGRSTGKRKTNGAMKIEGQFVPRPSDMLASPAYRVLSLSAHRVLSRIEVEHCAHGGFDNGSLPVTFQNFEDYGIDRHAIAPAIRECVALGFLKITERGRPGNGEFRKANRFRIAYLPLRGVRATHDWRQIKDDAQAVEVATLARDATTTRNRKAPKKRPSQDIDSGGESPTLARLSSGGEIPTAPLPRQWGKPTLKPAVNPHWVSKSQGAA